MSRVQVERKSLEAWCLASQQPFVRIAHERPLYLPEISPVIEDGKETFLTVQRAEVFCGKVVDARLFSEAALVITADGSLLAEGLTHKEYAIEGFFEPLIVERSGDTYVLDMPPPARKIDRECIYIGGSTNFGHFLYEYLARLAVVNQCQGLLGLPVLIYDDVPKRFLEFLDLAGYDESRRILIPRNANVEVASLWMPSCPIYRDRHGRQRLWTSCYHFLRSTFSRGRSAASPRRRRLYFSRAGAANKRVVNEPELIQLLAPSGFEILEAADFSISEQLDAVCNAEVIWCPIGAASSITVFAPDDCLIVEMLGDQGVFGAYNSILAARSLGQSYVRIFGERVFLPDNTRPEGIFADFRIDVELCRRLLDVIEFRLRKQAVANP